MITAVPGIRAGHWTGEATGVTVVLAPAGTIGSGEVRGGAPATRETDLLAPGRLVERVDAVVLTGGSAFGLDAASGVVQWLRERGQGFPTSGGPVPIVPAAAIYDLGASDPGGAPVTPQAADGYAAAVAAARGEALATGPVGAGRGARVGKWKGVEFGVAGGVGTATCACPPWTVGAVAVVNAIGDVVGDDGAVLAGSCAPAEVEAFPVPRPFEQTTLAVVATDAAVDRAGCFLLAQSGHTGFARALRPTHTRFDGDAVFSLATGDGPAPDVRSLEVLRLAVVDAVAAAIRSAVATGPAR